MPPISTDPTGDDAPLFSLERARHQPLSHGVRVLLRENLGEILLLPGRLLWAALSSAVQKRNMADLIETTREPQERDGHAASHTHPS